MNHDPNLVAGAQGDATPAAPVAQPMDFDAQVASRFGMSSADLESSINAPKVEFAAPYVEHLNTMAAKGATFQQMTDFMSIAGLDDNAPSEVAIKTQLRLDNPQLTKEHIDAMYADQYGFDDTDPHKVLKEAKLITAAAKAKAELQQKKDMFKSPNVQQQLLEEQQINQLSAAWQPLVANTVNSLSALPIELAGEEGDKFSFEYKPNLTPAEQAEINQLAMNLMVSKRSAPTAETMKELAGQVRQLISYKTMDRLILAAARSAFADGKALAAQSRATNQSVPSGSGPRAQPLKGGMPERKGYL